MTNNKPYYCYIDKNKPVVTGTKPDEFETLPYHYVANSPTLRIAVITYKTNLKIMKWRS